VGIRFHVNGSGDAARMEGRALLRVLD
jgi:hypothetical protein